MAKKTLKGWHESKVDLDEYLPEPCEIDEKLFNYLGEIVSPQYCWDGIVQLGEIESIRDGVRFFMSASMVNGKYFYLGVLPKFKQPKS